MKKRMERILTILACIMIAIGMTVPTAFAAADAAARLSVEQPEAVSPETSVAEGVESDPEEEGYEAEEHSPAGESVQRDESQTGQDAVEPSEEEGRAESGNGDYSGTEGGEGSGQDDHSDAEGGGNNGRNDSDDNDDNGGDEDDPESSGKTPGESGGDEPDFNEESAAIVRLRELVNEAKALDTKDYNETSQALFAAALDAGEAGLADPELTEEKAEKLADALEQTAAAMIPAAQDGVLYDGTYEVTGRMRHATQDQASMGNAAIVQPMQLIVAGGKMTLRFRSVALTAGSGKFKFTGYLGELVYYPDYTGTSAPTKVSGTKVPVESYYSTYDAYNHPKTGTDAYMKGKKYPEWYRMPVSRERSEYWVQVYVPVMEAISGGIGGGRQYAKFQIDWDTLRQTGGASTEKAALKKALQRLKTLQTKLADGGKTTWPLTEADSRLLLAAIEFGDSAAGNINIDQNQVDAAVRMLGAIEKAFGYTGSLEDTGKSGSGKDTGAGSSGKSGGSKSSGGSGSSGSSGSSGRSSSGSGGSGKSGHSGKSKNTELDIQNLADGTYSIEGTMVKIDRSTLSMSNNAINHTIKLTVSGGKYYLTLNFTGLDVNGQKGYLGTLWYFKSGYGMDGNGAPTGSVAEASVDSVQKDEAGKVVADSFGSNYPDHVTFPMIDEAKSDGYCPLRVFVPIMEAISAGTGTQPVYLKLNRDSLKSANKNAPVFDKENAAPSSSTPGGSEMKLAGGSTLGKGLSGSLGNSSLKKTAGSAGKTTLTAGKAAAGTETTGTTGSTGSVSREERPKEPPLRRYVIPGAESVGGLGLLILAYLKRRVIASALL